MVTINGYTAERMKAIEDNAIVDGEVVGEDLILKRYNGQTINAGHVRGFPGISDMSLYDPVGVAKPLLIGTVPTGYGVCDAATEYVEADYPLLAAAYGTGSSCINGASAPGKFRLPNLKGRTLVGLDASVTAFNTLHKVGGSRDSVTISHSHTASSDQAAHSHTADQPAHAHNIHNSGEHSHGVGGDAWDADRILFTYSPSSVTIGSGGQEVTYTHIDPAGVHSHGMDLVDPGISVGLSDPDILTTVNPSGVSGTDANLPPYRVVRWIMRLA